MDRWKVIFALIAALVPALLATGCGSDEVPSGAVATVDGEQIDQRSFDHWIAVAAKTSGRPDAAVPKPPDYAACVKGKRDAKPAEGQPKVADSDLKRQCEQEYDALREQVIQLLVTSRWLEAEARERGISVSDADVKERFGAQRKQSFPKRAQYEKFLEESGQSEQDILLRVRIELLTSKLQEQVTEGADKVTDQQITDYYDRNRERFAQPERRDVRLVLTATEAKATRAKAALARSGSWRSVAKRFSLDDATKSKGGKLAGVTEGQQEKALDDAIFAAAKGRLTGPVRTQFGHYVFEVTRVTRGSQQTRQQAKETIKQLLVSEKQQKLFDDFTNDFRAKWKARTRCHEGFLTQECENAPEAAPTPSQTTGGPQPGSPQP
jgi:foldase protein PrsA